MANSNKKNVKSRNQKCKNRTYARASKRQQDDRAKQEVQERAELANDPNWYFTDANLMDLASKFSFNNILGVPTQLSSNIRMDVPTIMRLAFNPSPGVTGHNLAVINQAAINRATLKLYTQISSQSGKTTNYGPQDLGMVLLALGEIISMVEMGRRALGLAFTYNQRNRAYPKDIITASGIDADSLLKNLAQAQMDLNIIINSINKIPFPANISYFSKCAAMYSSIYLDAPTSMAQTYVYVPYSTWVLDEKSSSDGSVLKTEDVCTSHTGLLWADYLMKLNKMVTAIMESSTYNYIYGDILNLAAKTNVPLLKIGSIDPTYAVMPVFNENALLQINNANFTGAPHIVDGTSTVTANNDVKCVTGSNAIMYNPSFNIPHTCTAAQQIVNVNVDNPDVATRIDATRFKWLGVHGSGDSQHGFEYNTTITLPDHYPVCMYIYGDSISADQLFSRGFCWVDAAGIKAVTSLEKFDYAPRILVINREDLSFLAVTGDFDQFTTIDQRYLERVNALSYQALFELR